MRENTQMFKLLEVCEASDESYSSIFTLFSISYMDQETFCAMNLQPLPPPKQIVSGHLNSKQLTIVHP